MKIKYVNNINQEVEFANATILPTSGSLHKRAWSVDNQNDRTTLSVNSCTYQVILTLKGSLDERKSKLDRMCDVFEYDCAINTPGTMFYGNYKIQCFIIGSNTAVANVPYRSTLELSIYCPKQSWVKEKQFVLNIINDEKEIPNSKKYAYRYPFVYTKQKNSTIVVNDSIIESDFILRIYGPCTDPFVKIGDNVYRVYTTLFEKEYLEIDTQSRTIFSFSKYGERKNLFHLRSLTNSNFFEKINPGSNNVIWNGDFKAEIILYEKRGEPKWMQ